MIAERINPFPSVIEKPGRITIFWCHTAELAEDIKLRLVKVANKGFGYVNHHSDLEFDGSLIEDRAGGNCVILGSPEEPLGFALVDDFSIGPNRICYLPLIVVNKQAQGQNRGTELIIAVLDHAIENKAEILILRTQNPRLLRAIEKATPQSLIPIQRPPTQTEGELMQTFIQSHLSPADNQVFDPESWIFTNVSPRRGDMGGFQPPLEEGTRVKEIDQILSHLGLSPERRQLGHSMTFMINLLEGEKR